MSFQAILPRDSCSAKKILRHPTIPRHDEMPKNDLERFVHDRSLIPESNIEQMRSPSHSRTLIESFIKQLNGTASGKMKSSNVIIVRERATQARNVKWATGVLNATKSTVPVDLREHSTTKTKFWLCCVNCK